MRAYKYYRSHDRCCILVVTFILNKVRIISVGSCWIDRTRDTRFVRITVKPAGINTHSHTARAHVRASTHEPYAHTQPHHPCPYRYLLHHIRPHLFAHSHHPRDRILGLSPKIPDLICRAGTADPGSLFWSATGRVVGESMKY